MNKAVIGGLIFVTGVAIGYKVGEERAVKDYAEWQKAHTFRCWKPKKRPMRPGDYPSVFVIETKKMEANNG